MATKPFVTNGGIRHHGDITKSVRFGAAMVMTGSLFAGHEESPGATVEVDGKLYKEYYGSASDFIKGVNAGGRCRCRAVGGGSTAAWQRLQSTARRVPKGATGQERLLMIGCSALADA